LGKGSEKKVACPLDQVLLADSILSNGLWCKASLVQSFITTILWSLHAINAYWCQLAISQKKNYIPFLSEDACLTVLEELAITLPNHSLAIVTNLYEIDLDGNTIHKLDGKRIEEDDSDGGDGDNWKIDQKPPSGLEVGPIDEGEVKETLWCISQALDISDREDLATGKGGRLFSSLATKEWVIGYMISMISKFIGILVFYSSVSNRSH